MNFTDLNLSPSILRAINDQGFTSPSDIQEQAIPKLIGADKDFVGQAQTGTGKTAAFVIPMLENINAKASTVQSLVLAPTRELANQVYEEIEKLGKYTGIKATTVYGGVPYQKQINDLRKGKPQIVVGTPGRIIDLIDKDVLKLNNCKLLTIDEADEMLNMGFIEDVQLIIDKLDDKKKLWMFSATMPPQILKLIDTKFNQPEVVKVAKKTLSNENITQYYYLLKKKHFSSALKRILDAHIDYLGVVFCETKRETSELADQLQALGMSAASLHGDLNQVQRDISMRKFKEKKVKLLVCTDVAARGIDVSNVTHVFNMGLPRQLESYVHRIGRTGRAGLKGVAISFMKPEERRKIKQVERLTGQKMEAYQLPSSQVLKELKVQKELTKMDGLKAAIVDKENAFKIDETFALFQNYFQELSREQIMQLMFSYSFNRELRNIDDSEHLTSPSFSRGDGEGASRRKPRQRSRSRFSSKGRGESGGRSRSTSRDGERGKSPRRANRKKSYRSN